MKPFRHTAKAKNAPPNGSPAAGTGISETAVSRPLPEAAKAYLASLNTAVASDDLPPQEVLSVLEDAGQVTVNDNTTYSVDYLRPLYPAPLFKMIVEQCRPLIRGYYLGATWNETLKKLSAPPRSCLAEEVRAQIQPIVLTIEEAVILAKISRDTIERMIRSGDLRAANMAPDPSKGKACWRLRRSDIEDLIDRRLTARPGYMAAAAKKRPLPK